MPSSSAPFTRALAFIMVPCLTSGAALGQWTFRLVANSSTLVPGTPSPDPFDGYFGLTYASGRSGQAVFYGVGTFNSGEGIYSSPGAAPLTVLADRHTTAPGTGGAAFDQILDQPSFDGSSVSFVGRAGTIQGVYNVRNGLVTTVVDNQSLLPGGALLAGIGTTGRPAVAVSGPTTAFIARHASTAGAPHDLYSATAGSVVQLAGTSTPAPNGSGAFAQIVSVAANSGLVAFDATDGAGNTGVYTVPVGGGSLGVIADSTVTIPGSAATFALGASPSISAGNVAFGGGASVSSLTGVYARIGGSLLTVADLSTPAPGGGTFGSFLGWSISGNDVVFAATHGTQSGLYLFDNGAISKVIESPTPLPAVAGGYFGPFIGPEGFDGTTIAFSVLGGPQSTRGIYIATLVPGPGAIGVVALVGFWAARRRRAVSARST